MLQPSFARLARVALPTLRDALVGALAALALLVVLVPFAQVALAEPPHAASAEPTSKALEPAPPRAPVRSTPTDPSGDAAARARSTPRRSLGGFLKAAAEGDFVRAADFLDLRNVPRERRLREGPELAAMLYRVLTWRVVLDPSELPDERETDSQRVDLDTVDVDGQAADIALVRVKVGADDQWLFSRETVSTIRALYDANQRRWLEDYVPQLLKKGPLLGALPWQWLGVVVLLGLAYVMARVVGAFSLALVLRLVKRLDAWVANLVKGAGRPVRLALGVAVFGTLEPYLLLPRKGSLFLGYVETTLYVVAGAWLLIALLRIGTTSYEASLPGDTAGHLASRGLRTRLAMLRRIGSVLIGIVASGIALLQFDVVRTVGLSLLASAGIASVLVGFAAQRTLGGIISGIEMSITQPLRIGDIVVVDGEWGTVERMFFTYLVLKLWDERRLIVPVSRVMSGSFENWTRMGSDMLAPVEISVDVSAPLDRLREEFQRLCRESPLWDGRRADFFVIDATERSLRVRGLASVDNASKAFDLRCQLREGWIRYLQDLDGGAHLPRSRVESVVKPESAKTEGETGFTKAVGKPGASEPERSDGPTGPVVRSG